MLSFIGKYLFLSHNGHEVVDVLNPNAKYELLSVNVPRVSELKMEIIEKRTGAAFVALDQSRFWIVGGFVGRFRKTKEFMSSTKFMELGQPSVKGPDLPFTIEAHSMIQYDEKSIYIIGGYQNGSISKKTWIVDLSNGFKITEGPSLSKERAHHGCAKMIVNRRTILVVAGGYELSEGRHPELDSVEILDPSQNNIWTQGLYFKSISVELWFNKSHFIIQDQIYHWD